MVLARYLCSLQVLKFDEYFIKIVPNDPKSWSQIVELIRNGIPKRFFGFGARILRIGHFSGWKSKFFEVSSWHFKHPIKLNFLIWHLERPYPDKKSILEKRQFKSCPLIQLLLHPPRPRQVVTVDTFKTSGGSLKNFLDARKVSQSRECQNTQNTSKSLNSKFPMNF